MDKILSEQRRILGRFEVVDFVDQRAIERLRDYTVVPAPVSVNWTWEYGSEIAELRRLYDKGKVSQWNAESDLDWDIPVTNDEWVIKPEASLLAQVTKLAGKDEATQKAAAFDELAHSISQLLHGEQAALQLCGQLTNVCQETDQKLYAASQVIDEARHVEVFAKFVGRKMGTIYPIGPTLKVLLDILLQAEGMTKKVLGMQTLFEGMAVGIMDMMRRDCVNPLFADILYRVGQDEARHAAFGVLNMRKIVGQASNEEMEEMEDWAFNILETLNANQQLDMLRTLAPKYDLDPEGIVVMATGLENFAEFNSEPYMHTVIPNLVNLGLLTSRTAEHWKRLGMMSGKRADGQIPLVS